MGILSAVDTAPASLVSAWAIFATVASLIIYFFTAAAYNLYFSPLAKYPGPFFAKLSGWPSFYHTVKGNRHIWIWQCHQIYGSTFRYCPDGLIFQSPTAYHAIYGTKSNVKKGKYYEVWPRSETEVNTGNIVDKPRHARKRRVLTQIFSENALRSAEPFIIEHVDRWCKLLVDGTPHTEWSEPKNVAHWSERLVLDILGELCYGKSFEIKEPGENPFKVVPGLIASSLIFHHSIGLSPFTKLWVWLKPKGLDRLLAFITPKEVRAFFDFIEKSVGERTRLEHELDKKGKKIRKDMFHYLIEANDPVTGDGPFTADELLSEAFLLTIAGSDTTATVVVAIIFYLSRNPYIYAKLAEEIRSTFTTVDEILSGPKLSSCHYLRACLDEAMRMNPPVTSDLNREVLPGGIEIDGEFVPEGTNVACSHWCLHHNEAVFLDPFVYRPERWIVDEKAGRTAVDLCHAENAFVPFSVGPRSCLGERLAYMELMVTAGRLLYLIDFKLPEGNTLGQGAPQLMWGRRNQNQLQVKDAFVAIKDGPMAQFKKRAN